MGLGGRKWLTLKGKKSYLERLGISLHALEILGYMLVDLGTSFLYIILCNFSPWNLEI